MASLLVQLNIWTLKNDVVTHGAEIGCRSYHAKGEQSQQEYDVQRRRYIEERGLKWTPSNRRPEKLRDALREVEELMESHRCIYIEWMQQDYLQVMLSNGVVLGIRTATDTGELMRIFVDKYLVGKLHSSHIVDVMFLEGSIIISYAEPKLTCVQFNKNLYGDSKQKSLKLSGLQSKVTTIDLVGPSGRRFERKLSSNIHGTLLLTWWKYSNDEVRPWTTPAARDVDRANIHIYTITGPEFKLSSFMKTDAEPVWVTFSKLRSQRIDCIVQKVSRNGDYVVDRCIYEIIRGKIQQISVTSIPLRSQAVCQCLNSTEDKLLLGCKDATLVLYNDQQKSTNIVELSFIPCVVDWHPNGLLALVGGERGHVKCFDAALSELDVSLISEDESNCKKSLDLALYFRCQITLQKIIWNPFEYGSCTHFVQSALIFMEHGPLAFLLIQTGVSSAANLTHHHLKGGQAEMAVKLLVCLSWNSDSDIMYSCLNLVVNELLKKPYSERFETQLEIALGTFYAPIYALSDVVILEYRERINCLARRYFSYLLRNERFEKAFLLAVDIGSRDLFLDLHHLAIAYGETKLAEVSFSKAEELALHSYSSFSSSYSSDSSSYSCSDCSSEEEKSIPSFKIPNNHFESSTRRPQTQLPIVTVDDSINRTVHGLSDSSDASEEGGTVQVVHFGIV